MENTELQHARHSLAHLMAMAVKTLYPDAKLTLGPAIDTGFYYDIDFGDTPAADIDLKKIQKQMKKTLSGWETFFGIEVSAEEARTIFEGNEYKIELVNEIEERGEKITVYYSGPADSVPTKEQILDSEFEMNKRGFIDLCRGGHTDSPAKEISADSFELDRVAGAYWRGDEKNPMLTRIYGLAFESKEALDEYKAQREEAKKRDHKKIGKELGLFTFSDLVGPGLPLFLPKGNVLKAELDQYMREEKEKLGYKFVSIPHIAKRELYETSGHMGKYDAMMPTMKDQHGDEYVMKAMNCPHHFCLYTAEPHSYRDLPLRYAENTVVYRNEKSGELSGLLRVKSLTQDDTHHFVRHDQIGDEIEMILGLMNRVYKVFGFSDYKVEISVRDQSNKEGYFGGDDLWEMAENKLIEATKKWGVEYSVEEGEAAFYGPKIDIRVKDALGRYWQLTTVQLDFNQPENFNMVYKGDDGEDHKVAVLHVAILGSIERFLGVLIEHYAGIFPTWLSPVQVAVLPISGDKHGEKAKEVAGQLAEAGIRTELYEANESLGKRIRTAKTGKVPYIVVLGDQEVEKNVLTVEGRNDLKIEDISAEDFIVKLNDEITDKQ